MSDCQTVHGFEDVWRPPARPRHVRPRAILSPRGADEGVRPRLARVAGRAPEVMVKVTGRTRDPGHLRTHMDYICRNGALEMEDRDGAILDSRAAVRELADDWSDFAMTDPRRRANTPVSLSLILSMPAETNPTIVRDAARAFAREVFADRFDYAFALHTDAPHPHVHIAVRTLGDDGERLNPKKADLEAWRQVFAQAMRDRGVEAEATPRRARGITRKAERTPLRKIRERHEAGLGEPARVQRAAYCEAARAAFGGEVARTPWETRLLERQARVRGLYLAQAQFLGRSPDTTDQALGARVEAFVRSMPQPDSRRLALARELRAANAVLGRERPDDGKERGR
ncbi:relaxase/mobilization nuclease domain-containing protein [Phenylobacterium sp.]|uniref:relaxase/mobilization nuclease domain-containing protein n=1 Tax=Phenylobacterium sp. TaxID=1871053 RepID=UPI0028A0AA09|nr:relaxase/mobilization nuclease domain-containing protein [Phenylobacterium sp.]